MTAAGSVLIVTEDDEAWIAEGLHRRLAVDRACTLRTAGSLQATDVAWVASHDLTFVRSRNPRLLALLARVERRGAVVVNRVVAIRTAAHRATALARVAASGIPTARDYEGPLVDVPFETAVLKSRFDRGRPSAVRWKRTDVDRRKTTASRVVYAQEMLPGQWEHKLYVVGDEVFAFVQRPTLTSPDKLATRQRTPVDPKLAELACRAAAAVGLEIAGVDFLEDDDGVPRVTDVNSNQGLHTFDEGHPSLERYLLTRLAS